MSHCEVATKLSTFTTEYSDDIRRQAALFNDPEVLRTFSDAVPDLLFILNPDHRVVHANKSACKAVGAEDAGQFMGISLGKALGCSRALGPVAECGASEHCRSCGAMNTILESYQGRKGQGDCSLAREIREGWLDLRVTASPITIQGEQFTLFVATDIANERRREVLERIFFHDVLNTAGALQGYLELLVRAHGREQQEFAETAQHLIDKLLQEISAQRELSEAESGEIKPNPTPMETRDFLEKLVELYSGHEMARSKTVTLAEDLERVMVNVDRTLLQRVVGNMITNALEASKSGQSVVAGYKYDSKGIEFWVRNEGCIPRELQLLIFQRSFSTKGAGRGLGTYSMRLLGEKYLGGIVSFATSLDDGTVFRIKLPHSVVIVPPIIVEKAA